MAVLSFPLSLDAFWRKLRIRSFDLTLGGGLQHMATGGGEVIASATGQRLWQGDVELVPGYDHGEVEGLLRILQGPGCSFLIEAHKRPCPLQDPNGGILGGASPVIASLPSGGRSLTLSGLPAGYRLSPGDFLSWTRDTPVRHELAEVLTAAVADGSGVVPEFDVSPGVRPGVVVGAAVTLVRPVFRAVIVPGSVKAEGVGAGRGPRSGPGFSFRQTLAKATA